MDEIQYRYNFYPNPVQTTLSFEYFISKAAIVSYDLFTLSGMLVYKTNPEKMQGGAHEHKIDVSQYSEGIYILQVRVNEKTYSEKIIKE